MGRFAWKPISVVTLTAAIAVVVLGGLAGAPVVDAGPPATYNAGTGQFFAASCSDDGQPADPGTLSCVWSQTEGANCTFVTDPFTCANNSSPDIAVSCTTGAGTLRLCCDDDGAGTNPAVCDTVVITGNDAPVAAAGADDDTPEDVAYSLDCDCTDDGFPAPPAATSCAWSESGDGTCTFGNAALCETTITCDTAGSTTVTCTCSDSVRTHQDALTLTITEAAECAEPFGPDELVCLSDLEDELTTRTFSDPASMVPETWTPPTCLGDEHVIAGTDEADTVADLAALINTLNGADNSTEADDTFADDRIIVTTPTGGEGLLSLLTVHDACIWFADDFQGDGFLLDDFNNAGTLGAHDLVIAGGEHVHVDALDAANRIAFYGVTIWESTETTSAVTLQSAHHVTFVDSILRGQNGTISDSDNISIIRCNAQSRPNGGVNDWCHRMGTTHLLVYGGWHRAGDNFIVRGGDAIITAGISAETPAIFINANTNAVGNSIQTATGSSAFHWRGELYNDPIGTFNPNASFAADEVVWADWNWNVLDDGFTTATLDGNESNCGTALCICYEVGSVTVTDFDTADLTIPDPPTINSAYLTAIAGEHASLAAYSTGEPRFTYSGTTYSISDPRDLDPADVAAGSDDDAEVGVEFDLVATCEDDNPGTLCTITEDGDCTFGNDATAIACSDSVISDLDITCGTEETVTFTVTCTNPTGVPSVDTVDFAVASGETPLPLDDTIAWNFIWWIPQRMLTAYEGPLITIRDVDDNAEIDVGCTGSTAGTCDGDGTLLDTAAIAAHCSDGTDACTVHVVHDQSGNNRDVTAPADANEALIYESDAMVTCGTQNIPCVRFADQNGFGDTGGDYYVRGDACGWSTGAPPFQIWSMWVSAGSTDDRGLISFGRIPNGSTPRGIVLMPANGTMDGSTQTGTSLVCANASHGTFASYLLENPGSGDNSDSTLYRNGSAMTVNTAGASDGFAFDDFQCAFGTMLFTNGSFTVDGKSPGGFASDDGDITDKAAIDTFLATQD